MDKCGTHWCWVCRWKSEPGKIGIYDHLRKEHGGVYDFEHNENDDNDYDNDNEPDYGHGVDVGDRNVVGAGDGVGNQRDRCALN
jgi:hypothetical protein